MTFDWAAASTFIDGMDEEDLRENLRGACEYCQELEGLLPKHQPASLVRQEADLL